MNGESGEQLLFDREGILVSSRRVVIRGDTIPIRAIASVSAYAVKQSHKGPMVLYAISPFPLFAGNWLLTLALAGAGAAWQVAQMKSPTFALAIRTMDDDGKELTGPDGQLFREVAVAINEAIASD